VARTKGKTTFVGPILWERARPRGIAIHSFVLLQIGAGPLKLEYPSHDDAMPPADN
jgi:hypothetical protein